MKNQESRESPAAARELSAEIQDQILDWLEEPGSLKWIADSVRMYWPRTRVADIKSFLQVDRRIRRRTGSLGEVLYVRFDSLESDLPPQIPRKPPIAPAPFKEHWQPLRGGVISCSWGELMKRLPATIEDLPTEYVSLSSPRTPSWHVALVDTHVGIRWVAWIFTHGLEALAYQSLKWHLWRPADMDEYGSESYRLKTLTTDDVVVATWAAQESLNLMRAVISDAVTRLHKASDLQLTVHQVSGAELERRRKELAAHENLARDLKREGLRVRRNPARGYCTLCGMPLSDPVSLERGIGPDCWARVAHLDHRRLRNHRDNALQSVTAREQIHWAETVRSMAKNTRIE